MHEGPQAAPEDPLPAASGTAVRVEESHRGTTLLLPAGFAAALQPRANPQQEQQQDEGQQQAEVDAGHEEGTQQPAEGHRQATVTLELH